MGNAHATDPDYWNVTDDPGVRNLDWMQRLPSSTSVALLSIPGTHDSMARDGGPAVWTQSLSLLVQLMVGVRFFDIRCRHFNDGLPIHHEAYYQNANFDEVLQTTIGFLDSHPSETVFMRVKEEYIASGNTRSFREQVQISLNRYPGRFWTLNRIPTLGESRRKIVILDNFAGGAMGIAWDGIDLEDNYSTIFEFKWFYVRNHLNRARGSTWSPAMFITFSSFASALPRDLARGMNPKLHSYVRENRGRLGIIASDYPGPKLIGDIIAHN
eukprot:Em0009g374a